ncbi:MAG: sensor histidine kinase [Saprospiraceae bacterium]|nr:sensor histidine kinase [Saprospiraceae bacterium]
MILFLARLATDNDYILFEVKDDGIGIPEDERKHLFDRFFRASSATNTEVARVQVLI